MNNSINDLYRFAMINIKEFRKLTKKRQYIYLLALQELPKDVINLLDIRPHDKKSKSGEYFGKDEASVWKRVIDYKLVKNIRPKYILETHPGVRIGSNLFKIAYSKVEIDEFYPKKIKYTI